jgi:hypothetical protein
LSAGAQSVPVLDQIVDTNVLIVYGISLRAGRACKHGEQNQEEPEPGFHQPAILGRFLAIWQCCKEPFSMQYPARNHEGLARNTCDLPACELFSLVQ